MKQREAVLLELAGSLGDGGRVPDLEFDADLRNRVVGRPGVRSEARPGGLRQRPHAKVLAAADLLTEHVLVSGWRFQGQAEGFDEQLAAVGRPRGDNRHTRDEQHLHGLEA